MTAPAAPDPRNPDDRARYPFDLAREVRRFLKPNDDGRGPGSEVLGRLFETLYFASLRTEEAQPILCTISYVDPAPSLPATLRPDRWSAARFARPLPLTIPNLLKLALAADPASTSLAVFHDPDGQLLVWGLIDQAHHHHRAMTHEAETAPERPGLFEATIAAPAHIAVYARTGTLVASLVHGELTHRFHDVLHRGPVHKLLDPHLTRFCARVREQAGSDAWNEDSLRDAPLRRLWLRTLCRVLLGIQGYQHGGALLLVPRHEARAGLGVKYELAYDRLGDALVRLAATRIKRGHARDRIWRSYLLKEDSHDLPADLYVEEGNTANAEAHGLDEVGGCVRFVSSLSRVDGLVLVDGELAVAGFGVEITVPDDPPQVLLAGDAAATPDQCTPADPRQWGTRHRSMMRYCWSHPGSVGFVVSQDGTVRAITRRKEQLLLWEQIELQGLEEDHRATQQSDTGRVS